MAKAYSVNVRVGATITDFDKKMKKVVKSVSDVGKKFQRVGKGLTQSVSVPILAAGTAMAGMTLNAAKNADELLRLSDVTGMSTTEIQQLQYAANKLGTDFETIEGAQSKLTRAVAEANTGNVEAIKNFESLGIAIYDNNGKLKDAPTLFNETLDALSKIEDPITRDALAMDLMGKSARDLNPLIKAGSDEINRLKQEALDTGAVMSEETVAKLGEFNDSMDAFKQRVGTATADLALDFIPVLEKLANILETKVIPFLKGIKEKFDELDTPIKIILLALGVLLVILPPLILFFGAMALAITAVSWPVLAVVAVIALLIAWIVAIAYYWDPIKKNLLESWEKIKDGFSKAFEGIKTIFTMVMDYIIDKFEGHINLWIKGINLLIKGANLIPGINIKTLNEVDFNKKSLSDSAKKETPINVYVGGQKLTSYTDYSMGSRAFS
jgi:ABC-type multidrug transport system fused ATPase/permease subunit